MSDERAKARERGRHHVSLTVTHLQRENAALTAELAEAKDRINLALDAHDSADGGWCQHCGFRAPCPTARALSGEQQG